MAIAIRFIHRPGLAISITFIHRWSYTIALAGYFIYQFNNKSLKKISKKTIEWNIRLIQGTWTQTILQSLPERWTSMDWHAYVRPMMMNNINRLNVNSYMTTIKNIPFHKWLGLLCLLLQHYLWSVSRIRWSIPMLLWSLLDLMLFLPIVPKTALLDQISIDHNQ